MEKQGASHPCPRVLHPCHPAMLLREEWRGWWLLCASMSMSMRGNLMHGTSCHHHHDDELFVCQCVLQPATPVCMSACAESTPVQAAGRSTHAQKRKEERVCVKRKRETASQMNQPSQATCVCVCVCV